MQDNLANRNNNPGGEGGGGGAGAGAGAGEGARRAGAAGGDAAEHWNAEEIDHFSFEDSDRFEEDSLCSWSSEPESVCNNWRGWKKPSCSIGNGLSSNSSATSTSSRKCGENEVIPLVELAAKCVASHIPFELVEHVYPPVPEQLQLRIAFWSFPDNEEDIRLYSCLANSSADEFNRGEQLFKHNDVKEPLQIGFHLSATVFSLVPRGSFKVAVTFDRRRISSCNCTCESSAYWCAHVVAVCLYRIHCPLEVCLRAPVSESLTRLQRDQLQKFAQYLISELPQQILPTAQRLLDELLSAQPTAINTVCGAPDPTAGASINDQTSWYLDEKTLHDNIKRIIVKFCIPAPIVFSDVNYLTNCAPPAAAEWSSLLRPLRGREPEGMWNLLSIVREMYRRCDRNAVRLLEIITEQCLACDQILSWWFQTKLSLMMGTHGHNGGKHSNTHSNSTALQHACSSLCDEIVVLWRLAALNPGLAPDERDMLHAQFTEWHLKILDRVVKCRMIPSSYNNKHQQNSRTDAELFVGFKPAIEACYLDWEDYPIAGITHTHDTNPIYYSPFTCFKHTDGSRTDTGGLTTGVVSQMNTNQVIMSHKHYSYISSSGEHTIHNIFKQRFEGPARERFYISSSNNSSNSSSDSVHARVQAGFSGVVVDGGGMAVNLAAANNEVGESEVLKEGSATTAEVVKNAQELSRSSCSAAATNNADGNRSSTSSEGFCENDDFGGDSSSNNVCDEAGTGGQTLKPEEAVAKQLKKMLKVTDPQTVYEPAVEAAPSEFKIPNTPGNMGNNGVATFTATLAALQLNSETSSSVSTPTSNGTPLASAAADAAVVLRRLSKDESCSSFSGDEDLATGSGEVKVPAVTPQLDLDELPSTSAAARAALMKTAVNEVQPQAVAVEAPLPVPVPVAVEKPANEAMPLKATTITAEKPAPHVFSNVRPTEDAWDILLARAEGLHAHGHGREACILAVRLAEEMLANPPNLMLELPPLPKRKGKNKNINPISHHLTVLASATLSKCAFLCTVLSENSKHHHIGFRICLFALEMPRPPASTKPLEVKLANQEHDILTLLKKIPLNEPELNIIRDRAERLRNNTFKSRGEALLPINLASFIVEALVLPIITVKEQRNRMMTVLYRQPSDENLGFEAAVAALGLKANVSEAEHPLLCEGTRRQRGDLALNLLCYYKDEPRKIAKIMEKLLDREIHTLLKTPLLPAYYSHNPPVRTPNIQARREEREYNMAANVSTLNDFLANDYGTSSRPHSSTSAELEISMNALNVNTGQACNGAGQTLPGNMNTQSNNNVGNTQTNVTTVNTRQKDTRYKGKRAYPSIPNQPSEASAHFMFELAKTILSKAGGNSSTSLFTQATTNQNHHGPHRPLHMCAFQLGLYALGLHNCVSPNWLSRTYSSHVSWIIGQAMEIGAPAISFLIDTWEGHLTPPEVASMADRASRGWDSFMIYPAAELALSVLPHAAALNPNEITRAILQCKEQSDHMLERACITVENAAKGGGVYPEVLFQVARYWYELYIRQTPNSEQDTQHDEHHMDHLSAVSLSALLESQQQMHDMQLQAPGLPPAAHGGSGNGAEAQVVVTTAPAGAFQPGVASLPHTHTHTPLALPPPYHHHAHQPYSFCQSIYHHHNITYPAANHQMQMYISTAAPPPQAQAYLAAGPSGGVGPNMPPMPSYVMHQSTPATFQQLPPQSYHHQAAAIAAASGANGAGPVGQMPPTAHQQNLQQAAAAAAAAAAAFYAQAPPPQNAPAQMRQQNQVPQQQPQMFPFLPQGAVMPPQQLPPPPPAAVMQHAPPPSAQTAAVQQQMQQQQQQQSSVRQRHPHQYRTSFSFSPTQLRYLMAAYNVGMLAMETLARRVHDDRPQAKYARSPPYGEDVKWLLRISKKLGTQYLHQFCICAVNSIVSPFVLHDVAIEAAHFLGRNNHQLVMQHLRSALTPLVQKCQQMYIQCIHQKLYHLTQADYEEFATIILAARAAFHITPEGNAQFKDWLQSIKRSKSCKKELWAQINTALQSNSK